MKKLDLTQRAACCRRRGSTKTASTRKFAESPKTCRGANVTKDSVVVTLELHDALLHALEAESAKSGRTLEEQVLVNIDWAAHADVPQR